MTVLGMKSQLRLDSRQGNQIENETNREPPRYGDTEQIAQYKKNFPSGNHRHRPTNATRRYNCHGLTFASRRTWIWRAESIQQILKEDDYTVVDLIDVMPGDVIVYYNSGDTEHSGVVVNVNNLSVPIILSKWGPCHEVIHPMAECPYDAEKIVFYRIVT
jgi:hypothetical protein